MMLTTGRLTTLVALLCCGLALAAAPASAKKDADRCDGARAHADQLTADQYSSAILCLLNRERDDAGLRPLRGNQSLAAVATAHSASMRDESYFEHEEPDGSTPTSRIRSTGYLKNTRRWMIGENIAWGQRARGMPATIVNAWMNSAGHRENILTDRFRDIGIGLAYGSPVQANLPDTVIITTDFGGVDRLKDVSSRRGK